MKVPTTLVTIALVSLALLGSACRDATPAAQPAPPETAPHATVSEERDGATQPASIPFEDGLLGADLAKYRRLPMEFQDALKNESEVNGREVALQHLRDLPKETLPVAEVLSPAALGWFNELEPGRQRPLLLGGYTDLYRFQTKELGEGEFDPKGFAFMFEHMVELAFDDGNVNLPPLEETLSAAAVSRLDTLDPAMRRAFRGVWEHRKVKADGILELAADLERAVLAAPSELPSIENFGLSSVAVDLFNELPKDIQEWLYQNVAVSVVTGKSLNDSQLLNEDVLRIVSTPSAQAAFARGLMPMQSLGHLPFECALGRELWPMSVTPEPSAELPSRPLFMPPATEVLSPEALVRLNDFSPKLQAAFKSGWESGGPVKPERLACEVAKWELSLLAAPLTDVPSIEDLISSELLDLYRRLPKNTQDRMELWLAHLVIAGPSQRIWFPGSPPMPSLGPDGTPDKGEFIDSLRSWMEHELWIRPQMVRMPQSSQYGDATAKLAAASTDTVSEDDLAAYRTLPEAILEALRVEAGQTRNDSALRLTGRLATSRVTLQDLLSADGQKLFDLLPVELKELFWRSTARELVYGSMIQQTKITAEHWVRYASDVPPMSGASAPR